MVQSLPENIQVIAEITPTNQKKTVSFIYQNSQTRKNSSKIIFGSKNILLKHKIRMGFYIPRIAKWLNNFN